MRRKRWVLLGALSVACGACTASPPSAAVDTPTPAAPTTSVAPVVAASDSLDLELESFGSVANEITASLLTLQPELVTELGVGSLIGLDGNYLLSDLSPRGAETLGAVASEGVALLAAVDVQSLSEEERVSVRILDWYLA
ncbi:MAG: hypothetical protein U9N84_04580, partial [Actinomycetota bacterium]|nr:hypothetical protein [Actinomycetota bacterium]